MNYRNKITNHAKLRMQQRGISEMQLDLLTHFGDAKSQKGGSDVLFMSQRKLASLRKAVDKLEGIAMVCSSGSVVTVMHMNNNSPV